MSIREYIVLLSALLYWGGVVVNIYRVRKQIGHSPNIKPRGFKEKLLWLAWAIVISGWIIQPLIINDQNGSFLFTIITAIYNEYSMSSGLLLIISGYVGTLWCYSALGDSWRIGVNQREQTQLVDQGPYRFVRHPIYLFQILMLVGAAALLPTLFSLLIILIHTVCIIVKALDEEEFLLKTNSGYSTYMSRTGRFFPGI